MEITTTSTFGAPRAASILSARVHPLGLLAADAYVGIDGTGVGSAATPCATAGAGAVQESAHTMGRTKTRANGSDNQGAPPRGRPV